MDEERKLEIERWKDKVNEIIERFPERKERFTTSSDIEVERVYGMEESTLPGEYPFTRGIQPTMYRSRFWTMRQYAGFGCQHKLAMIQTTRWLKGKWAKSV